MHSFKNKNHNNKTVVGFNTGHNSGCAIIHDGKIVSISEERLDRKKNSDGYIKSLFYCLKALKINVSDVDLFVSSSYHKRLPDNFMGDLVSLGVKKEKFITVDHHLSHAYSSYFLSPFKKSLVVVIDGLGNENDTESYYVADNKKITKVGGNNSKRSMYQGVGRAYESFTNYCGWSAQEAGKTMGLAAYGKDSGNGINLFEISENCEINSKLNGNYYHGAVNFAKNNNLNFGRQFSGFKNKDAAFYIQDQIEKIIIELINRLYSKYKIDNLCLAGGVFLNGIVNKKILDETPIKNIFIPPCCDDTGQPLGNALYGYINKFGNPKDIHLKHAYLGREYKDKEIIDVIEKKQEIYPLPYEVKSKNFGYKKYKDITKPVAKLLHEGNIVGWFQGGSEIGPRALGHRSILTKPNPAKMKDVLNERIKHREMFRPFAPIILDEYKSDYFEISTESPYMLLVAKSKPSQIKNISAVLHFDKTGRLQTVKKINGKIYNLLKEYKNISGIPVLLNTSFNDSGEPIVESPRDAMGMFAKNEIDYLVLNDYLIWKK